jgi:hypothetical protein
MLDTRWLSKSSRTQSRSSSTMLLHQRADFCGRYAQHQREVGDAGEGFRPIQVRWNRDPRYARLDHLPCGHSSTPLKVRPIRMCPRHFGSSGWLRRSVLCLRHGLRLISSASSKHNNTVLESLRSCTIPEEAIEAQLLVMSNY